MNFNIMIDLEVILDKVMIINDIKYVFYEIF